MSSPIFTNGLSQGVVFVVTLFGETTQRRQGRVINYDKKFRSPIVYVCYETSHRTLLI